MLNYRPSKPTLVLIVPFTTTVEYYDPEIYNSNLTECMNPIAVEPLGHGATHTKTENFAYWDSAIIFLQLLDALDVKKAFVLWTSPGGWIGVRMELLAPEKIQGLVLIGTPTDYESSTKLWPGLLGWATSRLWSGRAGCNAIPMPEFEPEDGYCDFLMEIGYGKACPSDLHGNWASILKKTYVIVQGSANVVLSAANAQEEIKLFTNSPEAKMGVFQNDVHFLSHTHKQEVHQNILDFVQKWQIL